MKLSSLTAMIIFQLAVCEGAAAQVKVTQISGSADGHIFVIPSVDDDWNVFLQLRDKQITSLLRMSEASIRRCHEVIDVYSKEYAEVKAKERNRELPKGSLAALGKKQRAVAADVLDELLTPEQRLRLTQLMYQVEIARMGLGNSLTRGRMSVAVGVHSQQKESLRLAAARIERTLREKIALAQNEAQYELFQLLAPEQRDKAQALVGEAVYYDTKSSSQNMLERALERVAIETPENRIPKNGAGADSDQ